MSDGKQRQNRVLFSSRGRLLLEMHSCVCVFVCFVSAHAHLGGFVRAVVWVACRLQNHCISIFSLSTN